MAMGCSDSSGPAERPPIDDEPDPPGPPPPPAPNVEGWTTYAVTLNNRLLLFGSENPSAISMNVPITGLPALRRIVGIDFHPSTGELYGVGNDSRVYVIDRRTGAATAVSATQFQPLISTVFDVHFAMGFEPATDRIRLISAEGRTNWSIDPATGIAIRGENVHYAAGDAHEGRRPAILGLAYSAPSTSAASARLMRRVSAGQKTAADLCLDIMWAIDAELAELIGSCDPDEGDFTSLGPLVGILSLLGCGEIKTDPEGNLFASLLWKAKEASDWLNTIFEIDPESGLPTLKGDIPTTSPVQGFAFDPGVSFRSVSGSSPRRAQLSLTPAAVDLGGSSGSAGSLSCTGSAAEGA
jgi:hypothetical protein